MAYGLEVFNSSGVCQFSTQTAKLVKLKQFSPTNLHANLPGGSTVTSDGFTFYGFDGPNSPVPYYTCDFDLPSGFDNTEVLVFARPASAVVADQSVQDSLFGINAQPIAPQTNIPRRCRIYVTRRSGNINAGDVEFLFVVKPGDATPETDGYGLEVYDGSGDSDGALTFSSRLPTIQIQQAGSYAAYNVAAGDIDFGRQYIMQTGSNIASGTDYVNDDPPFCLISNHDWYGKFGGGLNQNPSGARTGDPFEADGGRFKNCMVWDIQPDGGSGATWNVRTGFMLFQANNDASSSTVTYYGGTNVPHDYLTVLEGN